MELGFRIDSLRKDAKVGMHMSNKKSPPLRPYLRDSIHKVITIIP